MHVGLDCSKRIRDLGSPFQPNTVYVCGHLPLKGGGRISLPLFSHLKTLIRDRYEVRTHSCLFAHIGDSLVWIWNYRTKRSRDLLTPF